MNLMQQAELDLSFTLEDKTNGFGVDIVLIDSDNVEYALTGRACDIGFFIDITTGLGAIGRMTEVDLRISSIETKGASAILRNPTKWRFRYKNITFLVKQAPVDRSLGMIKLQAEVVNVI